MKATTKLLIKSLTFCFAVTALFYVACLKIFIPSVQGLPTNPYTSNSYELSLVNADLGMYDYISDVTKLTILTAMDSAHKKFPDVPIGLMHAITRTESEYRFWIDHPIVKVSVKGKLVTTNAIGLGGVIWDFWSDSLIAHGIAYNRSDLYIPNVGIMAEACVLHIIIKDVMSNLPKETSILSRIQSQYYGAYSNIYMSRMQQVTSDLWMKRMAREIKDVYLNINKLVVPLTDTIPSCYKISEGQKELKT